MSRPARLGVRIEPGDSVPRDSPRVEPPPSPLRSPLRRLADALAPIGPIELVVHAPSAECSYRFDGFQEGGPPAGPTVRSTRNGHDPVRATRGAFHFYPDRAGRYDAIPEYLERNSENNFARFAAVARARLRSADRRRELHARVRRRRGGESGSGSDEDGGDGGAADPLAIPAEDRAAFRRGGFLLAERAAGSEREAEEARRELARAFDPPRDWAIVVPRADRPRLRGQFPLDVHASGEFPMEPSPPPLPPIASEAFYLDEWLREPGNERRAERYAVERWTHPDAEGYGDYRRD